MNKQALYNKIMEKVAVTVKKAINEAAEPYSPSSTYSRRSNNE